jgi:Putative MetA-pathway of phenol degradation
VTAAVPRALAAGALAALLSLLDTSPAGAGRPLTTEDSGTLDPGTAEVELSLDYVRERHANVFLLPGGPVVNIGLLPRLEGTVAAALVVLEPDDKLARAGVSDTFLRLKYRFLDETSHGPALMAAVTARLPTGDDHRGLGEPSAAVQPLAVASKTFGATTLTLNAGYTFVPGDRPLEVVNLHASAETAVDPVWSIVGEIVADVATHRRTDDLVVVRAGSVHVATKRVKLDAAVAFGATRASPEVLLTIGVTITLD